MIVVLILKLKSQSLSSTLKQKKNLKNNKIVHMYYLDKYFQHKFRFRVFFFQKTKCYFYRKLC